MRTSHFALLLLAIFLSACATAPKRSRQIAPTAKVYYSLPSARPSEELRIYLEERLIGEPDNAIYNRDLGTLYQSRTTLVEPPERWRISRLANKHLEKAYETMPDDPQTTIFLGMARAYRGKDPEVSMVNKLSVVLSGFSMIDKAVAMDPDNYSLRLLRAKADLMAPALLNRGKTLSIDYAFLLPRTAEPGAVPEFLRALGLIFLGDYFAVHKDMEKGHAYWHEAETLDTNFKEEAASRAKEFEAGEK